MLQVLYASTLHAFKCAKVLFHLNLWVPGMPQLPEQVAGKQSYVQDQDRDLPDNPLSARKTPRKTGGRTDRHPFFSGSRPMRFIWPWEVVAQLRPLGCLECLG